MKRLPLRVTLSGILAIALGAWPGTPARAAEPLTVSFLDVGQGDCELLQMPSGEAVLIDAGLPSEGDRVVGYLRARGVSSLDLVIMTHPHADHIGGIDAVLDAFPVRMVLDSGQPYGSRTYRTVLQAIADKGIALKLGRAGMTKDYGPVHMAILAPEHPLLKKTHSDPNNNSIVTRWTYGTVSFLMTGDVEKEGLKRLLKQPTLQAQILKVPHHGSRYTSTLAFLKRVKPELAVISAGQDNDYGHPHPETLDRLAKVDAKIDVTAENGNVTVTTDGETYDVKAERP